MYRFQFDFTPLDLVALDQNFISLAQAVDYLQQQPTAGVVFQAPFTVLDGNGTPAIDVGAAGGGQIGPPGSQFSWDSAGDWFTTGNVRNLFYLSALHDVAINAPQPGQLLMWTGISWVNAQVGTGGIGGTGVTMIAPFNVITPGTGQQLFAVNADGSTSLGDGLTMDQQGHTWIYEGLTTYPLAGSAATPGTPSIALHGNNNSSFGWLQFIQDTGQGQPENYIGGIGGGAELAGVGPSVLQFLGSNGFAFGIEGGSSPCMTIGIDCSVKFSGPVSAPTAASFTNTTQVATTAFVQQALTTGISGQVHAATNGYVTLPGSIIIQWGTATAASGEFPVDIPVTFPKPFPNACFHVSVTTNRTIAGVGSEANLASNFADNITTTGCTIVVDNRYGNPSVYSGMWMALGW
jgi:hypothetical protein